jgi:hypothetical protein
MPEPKPPLSEGAEFAGRWARGVRARLSDDARVVATYASAATANASSGASMYANVATTKMARVSRAFPIALKTDP